MFWSVAIDKELMFCHLGKIDEAEEELLVHFDAQINVFDDGATILVDLLDSITNLVEVRCVVN